MPELNPQQKQAIQNHRKNTLVSAAAGSGKTFVLAARVTERLLDEHNPTRADRLLISTFTKAAAAQLKSRIRQSLAKSSAKNPRLAAKQMLLLDMAQIGTIDSFCLSLVKENCALLGLTPNISVSPSERLSALESQVMDEVLDAHFTTSTPEFIELATILSGKTDTALADTISQICTACESLPDPVAQIRQAAQSLDPSSLAHEQWQQQALLVIRHEIERAENHFKRLLQLAQETLSDGPVIVYFVDCIAQIKILSLACEKNIAAVCDVLETLTFPRFPGKKKDDPEIKEVFKEYAETGRKIINENLKGLLPAFPPAFKALETGGFVLCRLLCDIACEYLMKLRERKEAEGIFGFADICRFAFELLLTKEKEDAFTPTPLAKTLSNQYDEIMIDEFQDINTIQFLIYQAVSTGDNLFMVGDVKQSIYGFRSSRPEIFTGLAKTFARNREAGIPISLNSNYRSHPAVLDAANFIFSLFMRERLARIEYDETHRLCCGRPDSFEGESGGFELALLQKGEREDAETEAAFIASKINELMQNPIKDDEQRRKPVWADFCVMTRTNSYGALLSAALSAKGVPCQISKAGSLFDEVETAAILAALKAINNPADDVSVLSALMSPIWGFSPDDLAVVTNRGKSKTLYARLSEVKDSKEYPTTAARCTNFLSDISLLQGYTVLYPVSELISALLSLTDFEATAAAMGNPAARAENIAAFIAYTAQLEEKTDGGLTGFIEICDRAIAIGNCPQVNSSPALDAVPVMTIHNSKGLEYPFCFLAGCHKPLKEDFSPVVFDTDAGCAIKLRTPDGNGLFVPQQWSLTARMRREKEMAEQLRLLYVALTRAKLKTFAIAVYKDCGQQVRNVIKKVGGYANADSLLASKIYGDWLIMAALLHPCGDKLRLFSELPLPVLPAENDWDIGIHAIEALPPLIEKGTKQTAACEPNAALLATLHTRLSYVYPHEELCDIPQKYTVTELVGAHETELEKPVFIAGERGSNIGTVLHDFLSFCDFSQAAEGAEALAKNLYSQNKISSQALQLLNFAQIDRFFASPLFSTLCTAEKLYKEYDFLSEIPLVDIFPETEPQNQAVKVLLQGRADCIAVYDNGLLIVDYKTDRGKTAGQLAEKYGNQLRLYAQGISVILGLPVRKMVLYAFALGQEIQIEQ